MDNNHNYFDDDFDFVSTESPSDEPLEKEEKTEELFTSDEEQEKIENLFTEDVTDDNEKIESLFTNDIKDDNVIADEQLEKEKLIKENKLKDTLNNVKKLVKEKSRVLPIMAFTFVFVLGIYIFINNVKADIINLIKIEQKEKVGYINNSGDVVVKPKYLYGSDFYNGYAIVKNYNDLYGIIDGKGNNEIAFGNIFSANLYGNRYIVTKFTNEGLKMGLLDSNLKDVTRFVYDNLSYSKAGIFMYTDDKTMGILNNDGKEIYSYKVEEIDDKNISIDVSNIDDDSKSDIYAKIKVNDSSTIINTKTGKEVYKYTLDDIRVLDNNVFYVKNKDGNNRYFVIKNDKIVYETNEYKRLRIESLDSDILIAIKEDSSVDYINLLTREKINKEENTKYTYSDGVVLEEMYNFNTNKNEFTIYTPKKVLGTFYDLDTVDDTYVNGYMKIKTSSNKYAFINKKGNIISKEYDDIYDFNENGFAIVRNDDLYGVINESGKVILKLKYDDIRFLDDNLFDSVNKKTNEELFIFKENNKYGIIDSTGKVVVKPIYEDFDFVTTKYPIIKAKYKNNDVLINLETFKDLSIQISKDLSIYENYIISNYEYYNYDGELIYTIGG